jgi:hypothetical protein
MFMPDCDNPSGKYPQPHRHCEECGDKTVQSFGKYLCDKCMKTNHDQLGARRPEPPLDPPAEPSQELDLALTRAHSQLKLALGKCEEVADILKCNYAADVAVEHCDTILRLLESLAREKGVKL